MKKPKQNIVADIIESIHKDHEKKLADYKERYAILQKQERVAVPVKSCLCCSCGSVSLFFRLKITSPSPNDLDFASERGDIESISVTRCLMNGEPTFEWEEEELACANCGVLYSKDVLAEAIKELKTPNIKFW